MADIHPWQPSAASEAAARRLAAGHCVALPTDSGYALTASALEPAAVERLRAIGRPAFAISEFAELFDWLPLLRGAAVRLLRKAGPASIVMEADAGFASGLWRRLPEATRQQTAGDGRIWVRWCGHPIWPELREAGIPLVIAEIPNATGAAEASAFADCVMDAGPASAGQAPAVVQALGRRIKVQSVGSLTAEQIEELALCRILFICTGNTCRSPMARALCEKLLGDALGCTASELRQRGYCVQSAGLAAMTGCEASPDAVKVVQELGAELNGHCSQMVTRDLLEQSDFLFGMTAGHCWTLESIPLAMPTPRLLAPDGSDIADPIGGTSADYKTCAQQILDCLKQRLPELLEA